MATVSRASAAFLSRRVRCLYYLRQAGYVIVVVCLSVCLFASDFDQKRRTDLHEIFREV